MATTKAKPKTGKKPAAKKKGAAKAKAAPLSKWQQPEYLAAYDGETMAAVTRRNKEIYRLKEEWELAHSKAERLKKELKENTEERELYMRERDGLRGKDPGTLFGDAEYDETLKAGKQKLEETRKGNQLNFGEPADGKTVMSGWFPENIHQRYPLADWKKYGLQDKDIAALADGACKTGPAFGPIDTVGRLQEYQTPGANGWQRHLNDIKGIGPAAVQRIEDAGLRFWNDWSKGLAEEFARQCGYTEAKAEPEPKKKGKAGANSKAKPGTSGGTGKAHGKRDGGKPRSADRKPAASKVAERLINELADGTAIPDDTPAVPAPVDGAAAEVRGTDADREAGE